MLFLSEMVDLRWNLSASVARAYDGTNATRDKGSATWAVHLGHLRLDGETESVFKEANKTNLRFFLPNSNFA